MPTSTAPDTWRQQAALHWRMTRPAFLTITLAACLLGVAHAAVAGGGVNVAAAVATVLLACVAHAGANVLNDYHDSRNGADAANDSGGRDNISVILAHAVAKPARRGLLSRMLGQ